MPFGSVRVKVSKGGYAPVEGTLDAQTVKYTLDPIQSAPEGMVRVPASRLAIAGTTVSLRDSGWTASR